MIILSVKLSYSVLFLILAASASRCVSVWVIGMSTGESWELNRNFVLYASCMSGSMYAAVWLDVSTKPGPTKLRNIDIDFDRVRVSVRN